MKEAISGQTCSFPPLFVKAQLSLVPKAGERSFYFQSLSHLNSEGLAICRPFSKSFGGVEDKNHNLEAHAGHQLRCSYVVIFFFHLPQCTADPCQRRQLKRH